MTSPGDTVVHDGDRALPPPPPRRRTGTWTGLIISMALVLVVVLGWLALSPRPSRIERPEVDVIAKARQVTLDSDVAVAVLDMPSDWRATSVSWGPSPEGIDTWLAGYHRRPDDRVYLQLAQARAGGEEAKAGEWLVRQVHGGNSLGVQDVAGRTWQQYVAGTDPIRRSLVLPDASGKGLVTVLTGNVSFDELGDFAGRIRTAGVAGAGSPTSTG